MAETAEALARNSLYDTDFHEWTREQARLLREGRWQDLDVRNLVDEVEGVGSSQRREIRQRLVTLVAHLLNWKYQPGRRGASWQRTIRDRRREIGDEIEGSPSLRAYPADVLGRLYPSARLKASEETGGIDFTLFPETRPSTIAEVLDDAFMPLEPDLSAGRDAARG